MRVCASIAGSQAMEYLLTEDRILREVQTAVTDFPGPLSCGAQSSGDRERADNAAGKVGPDDRRFQSVAMDPVHERNVAASSRRQLRGTRTDDANFLSARDIRSLERFQQAYRSANTHLRSVRPHARSVVGTTKTPGMTVNNECAPKIRLSIMGSFLLITYAKEFCHGQACSL